MTYLVENKGEMIGERDKEMKFTEEQIKLIKSTIFPDSTNDQLQLFLHICSKKGIDPLQKQAYALKGRNDSVSIIVGIDGLRAIAQRTGKLAGISDADFKHIVDDNGKVGKAVVSATVTVKKIVEGHICEFTATAYNKEFNSGRNVWQSKPRHMLAKVAEALALRKAFTGETSGIYVQEEFEKANVDEERMTEVRKKVDYNKERSR